MASSRVILLSRPGLIAVEQAGRCKLSCYLTGAISTDFFSMPFVATALGLTPQPARVSAPQLVHLCVGTEWLALPVPVMVQSTPQPGQRCCATSVLVWPVSARAPEPLGLVSACATHTF